MSLIWNKLNFSKETSTFQTCLSKLSCHHNDTSEPTSDVQILKNIYGRIDTGELTALLGPSGAGKSTLINCLINGSTYPGFQGKICALNITGPIRSSFISQNENDHLIPSLTVYQSLMYASKLKNFHQTSNPIHEEIVENLIIELGLKSCKNTEICQCSNGEKKRLAIGLELTALEKPNFLFTDEPISGLDSYVGFKVIKLLSHLAKAHNMAIVTTIHQPSYKMFMQFNKAIIISGKGDIIFNDKPGKLKHALEDSGYTFQTGMYENPAEIAIEVASSLNRQNPNILDNLSESSEYLDDQIPFQFYDSLIFSNISLSDEISDEKFQQICQKMVENIRYAYLDFIESFQNEQLVTLETGLHKNASPFTLHKFKNLLFRCIHTSIIQQKKFTFIKLFLHLIVALVLAILYQRNIGKADSCINLIYPDNDTFNCSCILTSETLKSQNSDLSQKNVAFQFFSLLFLMFASLMTTVLIFPTELKLFLCEFRNGWYSTSTYYFAKTITEIPFQLIFPSIYVYFLYWYSNQFGMDDGYDDGIIFGFMTSRFSHFLGITLICCFIAQGIGIMIGIICVRSFNISVVLSCSLLLFLFLFSGFFVKRAQMNQSVEWLTYLSFVRFGLESLLLIIYGKGRCTGNNRFSSVLLVFDLDDGDVKFNVKMLIAHLIVTRFMAFVLFKWKADPNIMFSGWVRFKRRNIIEDDDDRSLYSIRF